MSRTCIVVVDGRSARFFCVVPGAAPRKRAELVEQGTLSNPDVRELGKTATGRPRTETNTNRGAGPVHPVEAQRKKHRLEIDRRFARDIARRAGELTAAWKDGTVMLIAEPRLLGLTRADMRAALPPALTLKELARNYAHFSATEIGEQLDL